MTGLAAVLRDLGELSQAKAFYGRVLAVASQDAHAQSGLAGVLHDLGGCAAGASAVSAQQEAAADALIRP